MFSLKDSHLCASRFLNLWVLLRFKNMLRQSSLARTHSYKYLKIMYVMQETIQVFSNNKFDGGVQEGERRAGIRNRVVTLGTCLKYTRFFLFLFYFLKIIFQWFRHVVEIDCHFYQFLVLEKKKSNFGLCISRENQIWFGTDLLKICFHKLGT